MGWIQIKMGHPLAQNGAENGAALAPFRANGAHPSFKCSFSFCRSAAVVFTLSLPFVHGLGEVTGNEGICLCGCFFFILSSLVS